MLSKLKQRKQEQGFTIIEVMIVLAIAGLIMVVVFMAVPALQRSGRNNALSSSAHNILTAAGEYSSNNGGSLPTGAALAGTTVTITGAGANSSTATVDAGTTAVAFGAGTPTTIGNVRILTGTTAKCNSTNTGIAGTASARSYVVLYAAEGSSGPIVKCVGS